MSILGKLRQHGFDLTGDGNMTIRGDLYAANLIAKRRVWYVDAAKSASGNGKTWSKAFATIQEAVDACSDRYGDIVLVGPGKYQENVLINNDKDGITIKAICPGWETQFRASDGATDGSLHAFSDPNTSITASGIGFTVCARSVTIDGFCMDGGGGCVGIYVGDGYGVADVGSTSRNAASARIINNLFRASNEGTNTPGLVLKGCSDNVIVENNVFRECDYGILISPGSGKTNQAPIIRGNHFHGCSTYGVYKYNENTDVGVAVVNNVFHDGADTMTYAVVMQGTGVHLIAGNLFGCTNKILCSTTDFTSGNFEGNTGGTAGTFVDET
jgi:hypothetical protein